MAGDSKLIKGKLARTAAPELYPGFSASGQDVWLDEWEHEGAAVVVSAVGARCGKAFLAHGRWSAIANTHVVKPREGVLDNRFLWYRINDERFWIRSGTAQPFVKVGRTLEREIALPPLQEQHRIVEAIESYLSRLDDAVALLERVQRNLERYRASVLKAAVEGRLVPTEAELARREGRDYEPASELLSYLRGASGTKAFGKRRRIQAITEAVEAGDSVLPEGWEWAYLADLALLINGDRGKNYPSKSVRVASGVPFINAGHITDDNRVDLRDMDYITEERYALLSRGKIAPGDILYCIRGSLGKAAVVDGVNRGAIASSLVIVRPMRSAMQRYILYSLLSEQGRRMVMTFDSGTAQPNLSAANLGRFLIPVPPLAEQVRIVQAVESLLSQAGAAAGSAEVAVARCAGLRQSILKWAFEGKLVEQDPNDEPASVLLERIKAEREKGSATNKGGKRRCRS